MIFSDIAGENGIFCDGDWIEKKDQDPNGEVRLIQLADIGAGEFLDKSNRFVSNATAESLNCTLLHEGDLLISRLGEPLCKACIFPLEGKFITAVDVAILRINSAKVDARYLLYLINSPWFKERIKKYESGTTRKRISRKNLDRVEMQFPTVSEQRRIVSRIEELFSELDNSVSTLQKTKEQLAVYRQAVLKEAFEGKFSLIWRKENPNESGFRDYDSISLKNVCFKDISGDENELKLEIPKTWRKTRLGEVFKVEVGGTPKRAKPEYWNGGIHWVSSGEVHFNRICETEETISEDGLAHTSTAIHKPGTVMLAMIGEGKTRGQAAILDVPAAHNQNTAAILVSETLCEPLFVYYFLLLTYDHTRRVGSGNNQKALNKERVKALRMPLPSFKEQKIQKSNPASPFVILSNKQ